MSVYVGLGLSLKETSVCVVDGSGAVIREGTTLSDPEQIAAFIIAHAPSAKRTGLRELSRSKLTNA